LFSFSYTDRVPIQRLPRHQPDLVQGVCM
jgi:hypothetical protein